MTTKKGEKTERIYFRVHSDIKKKAITKLEKRGMDMSAYLTQKLYELLEAK